MNREQSSLHEGSREITLTVSLNQCDQVPVSERRTVLDLKDPGNENVDRI